MLHCFTVNAYVQCWKEGEKSLLSPEWRTFLPAGIHRGLVCQAPFNSHHSSHENSGCSESTGQNRACFLSLTCRKHWLSQRKQVFQTWLHIRTTWGTKQKQIGGLCSSSTKSEPLEVGPLIRPVWETMNRRHHSALEGGKRGGEMVRLS